MSLGERIKELVYENRIERIDEFCDSIGVGKTDFYRWWTDTTMPTLKNAVKLANAFKCTLDFLVGIDNESRTNLFKTTPPFSVAFKATMDIYNTNPYKLSRLAKIGRTSINEWLGGNTEPSLDCVIRLSKFFDCTIDVLIGRE